MCQDSLLRANSFPRAEVHHQTVQEIQHPRQQKPQNYKEHEEERQLRRF